MYKIIFFINLSYSGVADNSNSMPLYNRYKVVNEYNLVSYWWFDYKEKQNIIKYTYKHVNATYSKNYV